MKYSVIIPTRDRLDLLKQCVHTVLDQDFHDWEIIISDNCSTENIKGWVESISDSRIKYFRTHEFVSVTKNWNSSIEKASGDYILMLGDDDGIIPGYFNRIETILEKFHNPSLIYNAIYHYAYPGAMPGRPDGYLAEIKDAFFFDNKSDPFWLSSEEKIKAYTGSLNLKRNFVFNIQTTVFSKQYVDERHKTGPFFKGPFPDYYAMNVAMLKAERVLVVPQPLSIVGISKKSFGFTYFSGVSATKGKALLNNEFESPSNLSHLQKELFIPGPYYLNNYMLSLAHFAKDYCSELNISLDFRRYRLIIIYQAMNNIIQFEINKKMLIKKGWFYEFLFASLIKFLKHLKIRWKTSKLSMYRKNCSQIFIEYSDLRSLTDVYNFFKKSL